MRTVALALAALLLGACSTSGAAGGGSPTPSSVSTYGWAEADQDGVAFRYPPAWFQNTAAKPSSFSFVLIAVSDRRLHDPCTKAANTLRCGWPLDRLGPGDTLVEWIAMDFPGWRFEDQPGEFAVIGGRRVRIQEGTPGTLQACGLIDADHGILALIEDPAHAGHWTEFLACLKGPGTAEERAVALAILHSARFGR